MLIQSAHVADGIGRGDNPQQGCDQGEKHSQSIDFKLDGKTRHNFRHGEYQLISIQYRRYHRNHD